MFIHFVIPVGHLNPPLEAWLQNSQLAVPMSCLVARTRKPLLFASVVLGVRFINNRKLHCLDSKTEILSTRFALPL